MLRERISQGALLLAVLVAIAASAGIWVPSVYAHETASWAAQGIGQDWIDLAIVAPLLAICALEVRRSSRTALLVLGGALIYLVYSFVLYAFAMHFNVLFLVYCATLGLAFYTLIGLALQLQRNDARDHRLPFARAGGGFLIVVAVAVAGLWLSSVIPALIRGAPPPELEEVGLITNPVHILDLSLLLPALFITGVLLVRGRSAGVVLGPIMMSFNALMTLALLGMMVTMQHRGLTADPTVTAAMGVLALISVGFVIAFARGHRTPRAS